MSGCRKADRVGTTKHFIEMKKKVLIALAAFLCYTVSMAGVNILKNTAVSCAGSSNITYINDGNYASVAQISSGARYVYFTLPYEIYNKKTHCYIYLKGDRAGSASITVEGRNNGGTWHTLGYTTNSNERFQDITCNYNYYIDEIRLRVSSPYSVGISEVVYASELESVSNISIKPNLSYNVDLLRDGLEFPCLNFSEDAKKIICYDLKNEYKNIKILFDFRNKYYSSGNIKVYLFEDESYVKVIDLDIFQEKYLAVCGTDRATKIKIELEGSHNPRGIVSLKEIKIFGNKIWDVDEDDFDYPQVSFAMDDASYRPMAEWEESEGILVYWPSTYDDLFVLHSNFIINLIKELNKVGKVFLLCNDINDFAKQIGSDINTLNNLQIIFTEGVVETFARDWASIPVYRLSDASPTGVNFFCHSSAPVSVASYFNYPLVFGCKEDLSTNSSSLGTKNLQGGNFSADQNGTAIVNFSSYFIPPADVPLQKSLFRDLLEEFFGADKQMLTEIGNSDTHIDYFMKVVSNSNILVTEYHYSIAEDAVNNFYEEYGINFNLITLPPGFYYTANSLIFNNHVFVLVPKDPSLADAITSVYQQAMPGYNIVPIIDDPATRWPNGDGSIHCLTMNIPTADPILMSKMQLTDNNQDIEFSLEIRTKSGVAEAKLHYRDIGKEVFHSRNLQRKEDEYTYNTLLTGIDIDNTEFYVEVINNNDKVLTSPYPGAAGPMAFKSVSNFEIIKEEFKVELYPNPATEQIIIHSNTDRKLKLSIYSLDGTLITEEELYSGTRLDVSNYKPGLYIIKIINQEKETEIAVKKLNIH